MTFRRPLAAAGTRVAALLLTWFAGSPSEASVLYGVSTYIPGGPVYTVNQETGGVSLIGLSGFDNLQDLASDTRPGSFRLWACDMATRQLVRIDPVTGAGTAIGSLNISGGIRTLAFDPVSEQLYGTSASFDRLYRIDPDTGAATLVTMPGVNVFGEIGALAFDPSGMLYGSAGLSSSAFLIRISTLNGNNTLVGTTTNVWPGDIAFRPEDGVMFASNGLSGPLPSHLFTVNQQSGNTILVGPYGSGVTFLNGLAFSPIPDPSAGAVVLMASSLCHRRRRAGCRAPEIAA